MPTVVETLKDLFPGSVWLPEVDPETNLAKQARTIEGHYTTIVQLLMVHPRPRIATLGKHLWDVVHYRHANVAMHGGVKTMHIAVVGSEYELAEQQCLVIVPEAWVEMYEAEPLMQWGAVIVTGSQAVDHYNGRFTHETRERIMARALAYEAEFLLIADSSKLNDYQRGVLEQHPRGFDVKYDYPYRDVAARVS